jgi:ribonuclease P protein component
LRINTLKKRKDFERVRQSGQKWVTSSFVLQALKSSSEEEIETSVRVAFIVTRKTGCSVERNRMKRRLRVLVRDFLFPVVVKGDYVFIARYGLKTASFEKMIQDLTFCLNKLRVLKS